MQDSKNFIMLNKLKNFIMLNKLKNLNGVQLLTKHQKLQISGGGPGNSGCDTVCGLQHHCEQGCNGQCQLLRAPGGLQSCCYTWTCIEHEN